MQASVRFRRTVIDGVLRALDQEILACKHDPARAFQVSSGRRVLHTLDGCFYAFDAETRLPIPTESPIFIQCGGASATGRLVAQYDLSILVHLRQDLGERVPAGTVYCEPWFIYEKARGYLEETSMSMAEEAIPLRLMGFSCHDRPEDVLAPRCGLTHWMDPNEEQWASLLECLGSRVHFVWGPPGTGKTANLAQICHALVDQGERVLVLAHANVAVDRAMAQIARACSRTREYRESRMIRVGGAQLRIVRDDQYMNPEAVLARQQPHLTGMSNLIARRDQISSRILAASSVSEQADLHAELQSVRDDLQDMAKLLDEALAGLISDARVIGTTLSKMAIDRRIRGFAPDAVLVDEASMAPFPLVLMASFIARRRLGIFGDFRQLPPVNAATGSEAHQWLGRDTFVIAGAADNDDTLYPDKRVTMLREQYRMAPPICDLVSRLAYRGRVRPAQEMSERMNDLAAMPPRSGQSLVMLDTSPLAPGCMLELRHGSFSRLNPAHAALALAVTSQMVDHGCRDIALITPYRIQARLLDGLIRAAGLSEVASASTVHRFQGSESDAVIFDLTDAHPQASSSQLTGKDRDHALRLLNVALSRARGKLVVLADCEFVHDMHPPNSPARRMINIVKDVGAFIRVTYDEAECLASTSFLRWYRNWDEAQAPLADMIGDARNKVYVNVPGFRMDPQLATALTAAARRLSGSVSIAAPLDTAIMFEESDVSLHLLAREVGAFGIIDDDAAFISARSSDGAVLFMRTLKFGEVLQEILVGMRK